MNGDNPGQIKLDLLYRGLKLGECVEVPEDPSGAAILMLPEDLLVNVTFQAPYAQKSPYTLHSDGGVWSLKKDGDTIPVDVLQPLKAYEQTTSSGIPVSDILCVHGGFVAVEPMGVCRFTKSGLECKYCRHKGPRVKTAFSARDLIEALEIIRKEVAIDIVHLSSGFVESEDGGILALDPFVREIRNHFNVFISLDVMPPAHNDWIDRTYAMGVDAVYYDIDVFDPDLFKGFYPEKEETIRFQRYLEALEFAAHTFPSGAVCTHLVMGLEPLESTLRGIKTLTKMGVLPVLTFFRPLPDSDLNKRWKLQESDVAPLYSDLYKQVVKHKINPTWIRQYDVLLTPLEGRFFAGGKQKSWRVMQQNFYKTAIGRKTQLGLASMRRNLRVKEIKKAT